MQPAASGSAGEPTRDPGATCSKRQSRVLIKMGGKYSAPTLRLRFCQKRTPKIAEFVKFLPWTGHLRTRIG
jgi:hypothetical protein